MTNTNKLSPVILAPKSAETLKSPRVRAVEETYKPTRQKRSAESEKKLLVAAEELFAMRGFEGTKVSDIIKKSGCSIGTFYHRFGDKDGLAKVMVDRYITDAVEVINGTDFSIAQHGNLRNMLSFFVSNACEFMTKRMGVYRAAQRLAQSDPDIWRDTGNLTILLRDRVIEFLDDYRDEIKPEDKETAMTNAVQLIVLVILQTRLGAGILFPRDDASLLRMLTNAGMGILNDEAA